MGVPSSSHFFYFTPVSFQYILTDYESIYKAGAIETAESTKRAEKVMVSRANGLGLRVLV